MGKAFGAKTLKIKVGDSVKFVNEDPFSHNVFSLSSVKSFDLGSYPQGGAKSVTIHGEKIAVRNSPAVPSLSMLPINFIGDFLLAMGYSAMRL